MRPGKLSKNVIGSIIIEGILFIDLAVDLYTGEMSWRDLSRIISLVLLFTIPVTWIMRRIRDKRKSQSAQMNRCKKSASNSGEV